jgi:hypothetical protein
MSRKFEFPASIWGKSDCLAERFGISAKLLKDVRYFAVQIVDDFDRGSRLSKSYGRRSAKGLDPAIVRR